MAIGFAASPASPAGSFRRRRGARSVDIRRIALAVALWILGALVLAVLAHSSSPSR
ncbi:MAG: hypothetical protein ACRDHP_11355 [Ktedonobacterales bacterium]